MEEQPPDDDSVAAADPLVGLEAMQVQSPHFRIFTLHLKRCAVRRCEKKGACCLAEPNIADRSNTTFLNNSV